MLANHKVHQHYTVQKIHISTLGTTYVFTTYLSIYNPILSRFLLILSPQIIHQFVSRHWKLELLSPRLDFRLLHRATSFRNESDQVAHSITHIIWAATCLSQTVKFRAQGIAPRGCING